MPPIATACWRTRLAAVLLPLLAACAGAQEPSLHALQADHLRASSTEWEPPPAVPEEVAAGSAWARVALPHVRARSIAEGNDSLTAAPDVVWYRLEVPPQVAAHDPFLYLPRWQTIGVVAVYVDGRLVHRTRGSRVWNSFNRPLLLPLADASRTPPRTVHVRMASQQGVGGALSTVRFGSERDLLWRHRLRTFLQADLIAQSSAAFLVLGLFSLAVWCVRRRETLYALFFAASAAHLGRMLHYVVGDHPPLLPDDWFGWMTVNSVGWVMVCVFAFAFHAHGRRMTRAARATAGLVGLCSLLTLPVPLLLPHLHAILPSVYIVIAVLTTAIAASGLWASYRARSREGLLLFGWFSLNLPAGIHDLLLQNYRLDIERVYLAPYTSTGLFLIFVVMMWRRYIGALRGMEAANASLESRLAQREAALTATHEQLRELERQQTLTAERQRLMQDMHDGIGSSLVSALRMVERGEASPGATAQVLQQCIDDLKLAIDSLETADTDLLGLLAAIRFRLGPRLHAAGIELRWSVRDLPALAWLDPQTALHVLRILQEVLANILKHSRASVIDVATDDAGAEVLVRIRDNGAPFAPDGAAAPGTGKGLANIRQRAEALRARCDWTAWEGGGEFRLWLPVARAAG
ncbi:sensor histidine kinase [Ramlibacter pallidus]|uniref:Histidine kinase n=1 Tax=Ramlibacter pallidus TaxID=2780087 RepID=A0ABR9S2L1_9BURK|nr:ATP-binding protein [Ramlibacter pallidus]MBE7367738.1 histidine kinase [Ramlibacter pallidus]